MERPVKQYLQVLLVIPHFPRVSCEGWYERENLIKEYETILECAYCQLTVTDNGSDVLNRLELRPNEIDLVLIHQDDDHKLLDYLSGDCFDPQTMNYFALGYKIKQSIPSKPVILTGPAIDSTNWENCADVVLDRPFYPPTLIRKICQLVEDKG